MTAIGATPLLPGAPAKVSSPPTAEIHMRHSLSEAGESGASLVKGGSERRVSAAWMPLTKTGRSPGITEMLAQVTLALTWPDLASVRGRPIDRPPHNGVQGTGRPSSQHVVLRTASCSVP